MSLPLLELLMSAQWPKHHGYHCQNGVQDLGWWGNAHRNPRAERGSWPVYSCTTAEKWERAGQNWSLHFLHRETLAGPAGPAYSTADGSGFRIGPADVLVAQ